MDHEHMTLGDWIITMIVLCIPCVNIIMLFVWAFGSAINPSKKTFCQAMLIFYAIGVVLYVLLLIVGAASMSTLSSYSAFLHLIA